MGALAETALANLATDYPYAPARDDRRAGLDTAADRNERAAAPHITGGDFAAEHWLATFAYAASHAGQP